MKKIYSFTLAILLTVFSAISATANDGSVREISGREIIGIDISSVFHVEISQSERNYARVVVPEKYADKLTFELKNGILTAHLNNIKNISKKEAEQCRIEISCSLLKYIDISGAVHVKVNTPFTAHDLNIDMSGASTLEFKGQLNLTGSLNLDLSGATQLSASQGITNVSTNIEGSGAAVIGIKLFSKSNINIDLSGAAILNISGSASKVIFEADGAAVVNGSAFNVPDLMCDISGASRVDFGTIKLLQGEISGAATLNCVSVRDSRLEKSGAANVSIGR